MNLSSVGAPTTAAQARTLTVSGIALVVVALTVAVTTGPPWLAGLIGVLGAAELGFSAVWWRRRS